MQDNKKIVLVTGGAGFIGSHLCDELLKRDYFVIAMDNISTGKKSNISHLIGKEKFQFIQHDVTIPIDLEVNFIFHFASPASPKDYQKLPIETSMANSLGTYNMLELSRKKNARILIASTSEVYGEPLEHPQKESYWGNVNPIGIRSCYDESKRFAEALATTFHKKHGIDVRIARIFNTYGPRMRLNDGRAIPNFVTQSISNKPVTVYGDGKQSRSFCFVSDTMSAIMELMFRSGLSGEVINIGNPEEMTINEVAKLIIDKTKTNSKIVFMPLPKDDPTRRRPDIAKAKEILEWSPKVSLDDGLDETIRWFRKELKDHSNRKG